MTALYVNAIASVDAASTTNMIIADSCCWRTVTTAGRLGRVIVVDPDEDAANDVGGRTAGVLLLAGLGMCGSTLLPWTRSSARQGSLWEISSAADVSVAALGSAAVVLACVVLLRGGCRAFLVAGAGAAALTTGPWAGEFVAAHSRDGDVFAYEGPTIVVGCAVVCSRER